eukprot:12737136-Alexandrium_andersonii.AAC.1
MSASLVGSEMCIRDRHIDTHARWLDPERQAAGSRALMDGLSERAPERVERGSVSSEELEALRTD